MEQIPRSMNSQENIEKNIELLEIVAGKIQTLDDRFAVMSPESLMVISGSLFVKNDTTRQVSFEGEYQSLSDLQKDISLQMKNLPQDEYLVESLQVEGFEKSNFDEEIEGTSFFRRLI